MTDETTGAGAGAYYTPDAIVRMAKGERSDAVTVIDPAMPVPLLIELSGIPGEFDAIMSNPPYGVNEPRGPGA